MGVRRQLKSINPFVLFNCRENKPLYRYPRGGKLLKNFFDCKDEKITEKAFSQSLIISVVSILLCIVALSSVTYAWFTGETTSGSNTLMSGSFDVKITVSKLEDGVASANAIEAESNNEGKHTYKLLPGT